MSMMPHRSTASSWSRTLREDPRTRGLPIVLLSARAGEESRIEGANHGADDYVVKPFSARELVARVRSQLFAPRSAQRREQAEALGESAAALAAANATLESANRRLLEIDRQRDQFIAMLSHELRNPLAPIRSGLDVLLGAAPGSAQALRAMSIVDRQVGHLRHIVDDLLDVTRIASGKVSLTKQRVDLNVAREAYRSRTMGRSSPRLGSRSTSSLHQNQYGRAPTRPALPKSSATCSRTPPSSPLAGAERDVQASRLSARAQVARPSSE